MPAQPRSAPLALRIALSAFVAFLVPYYWQEYGWRNFLWLSDISLFLTAIALWRRSRLIISMVAIGVLPLELFWNVDFFSHLFFGKGLGLADYMFDGSKTLLLRGVSLFHVALPIIWIVYLRRWRYDPRALPAQTVLLWVTLIASYLVTVPDENTNWVFVPQKMGWDWLPLPVWLLAYMAIVPVALHWPLHRLYRRWFPLQSPNSSAVAASPSM